MVAYSLVEAEIKPGEHLCSFYETKEEQFQIAFPFIVEGLARNEKCLYIADENSVDEVKAGLIMHGVDVKACLRSGQLCIMTPKEAYLKRGKFILDDMILQLDSFVYRALNEGYAGVRVTGELTWLIRELSYLEEFLDYEQTVNEVFRDRPVKLLCQYNSKKLFGNVILGALRTHPRVLIGLALYTNAYYEQAKPAKTRKKTKN